MGVRMTGWVMPTPVRDEEGGRERGEEEGEGGRKGGREGGREEGHLPATFVASTTFLV